MKVSRTDIRAAVLRIYNEQPDLHTHTLQVTFTGEDGEDFDGPTPEMLTMFWQSAYEAWRMLFLRVLQHDDIR